MKVMGNFERILLKLTKIEEKVIKIEERSQKNSKIGKLL